MQSAQRLREAIRGLSIGTLIKIIRSQLGISQKALARRAEVPQSTISRIELGGQSPSLSSLKKILNAMSCDLVIAPLLPESIDTIRRKQARKIAEKHIRYLKGTMNLEMQEPDPRFMEETLKREEENLLRGPNSRLWNVDE
ncbi:MAG: helix-turn-helix domain-containing protein [Verrucomicrobia bacterium]|nr:helix-turn-helix domain-containing protein [Verrucomicrobiota bacterium]